MDTYVASNVSLWKITLNKHSVTPPGQSARTSLEDILEEAWLSLAL